MAEIKIPAVDKLIDVVASGIGAVAGPVLARLTARMRADTQRIEAMGEADARRIAAGADADSMAVKASGHVSALQQIGDAQEKARHPIVSEVNIAEEVESRVIFQERKRQANIYNVVSMTAEELGNKEVEDHEVDHDWTARFFSDVQDVTSEQMQRIWARILSGEVETPGRTSLHTLSILRNMSQRDATSFANLSRFVIDGCVLCNSSYTNKIDGFPNYETMLHMDSYGLLSTGSFLIRKMALAMQYRDMHGTAILHGDIAFFVLGAADKQIDLPVHVLTASGKQIFANLNATIDESYVRVLAKYLKDKEDVELVWAPITARRGSQFQHGEFIDVSTGQPYQPQ